MHIFALTILILTMIIGFIMIFFTSIGTLIMFIGTFAYGWMTGFEKLSFNSVLILFALYLAGEGLEFLSSYIGSKSFGASDKAAWGAIIGGFAGGLLGLLFFGIGILPGTFLGIFAGALIVELKARKTLKQSLWAGTGGVIGRLGSIAGKVMIAILMILFTFAKIV